MPATSAKLLEEQGSQTDLVATEPLQQPPTVKEPEPGPASDQDRLEARPPADEIAVEAYALYAAGGYQDGHDLEHWLEAEKVVKSRGG